MMMMMNDLPPNRPMPPRREAKKPSMPPFNQLRPGAQVIGALLFVLAVLVLLLAITGTAALIVRVIRDAL